MRTSLGIFDQLSGHSFSASKAEGNWINNSHNLLLLSQIVLMSTKGAESSNMVHSYKSVNVEAGRSFHSKVNNTMSQQSPYSQSAAVTKLN